MRVLRAHAGRRGLPSALRKRLVQARMKGMEVTRYRVDQSNKSGLDRIGLDECFTK